MFSILTLNTFDIAMVVVWSLIAIAALVIEFETANLVSIWFVAGGITGIVCALFKVDIWLQIVVFVLVSGVFIIGTRPFVKKISDNQTILTNADRLVGKVAVVTKDIANGEKGEIRVEFQNWVAVAIDNQTFNVGDKVVITEIVGNKMVVTKVEEVEII